MVVTAKEIEESRKAFEELLEKSKKWEGSVDLKLFTKSLESDYFWIRDFLVGPLNYKLWKQDERKAASVFSSFYGEFIQRKQALEKRAMEISMAVSGVVQSIVRILYDLREYDRMLAIHKQINSKNKTESEAGMLTAKRVFMDEVDMKKGRGSINNMSQQLEFVSLRDSFVRSKSLEDLKKSDLNDRVKRIALERLREFLDWLPRWEKTLTQQKNLLLSHLKNQYGTLKLYVQWLEPYLRDIKNMSFDNSLSLDKKMLQIFDNNVITIEFFGEKEIFSREFEVVRGRDKATKKKIDGDVIKKSDKYVPPKDVKELESRKYKDAGPKARKLIKVSMEFATKPQQVARDQGGGIYRNMGDLKVKFSAHGFDESAWKKFEDAKKKMEVEEEELLITAITGGALKELKKEVADYVKEYEGEIKAEEKKEKEKKEKTPFFVEEILRSFKDNFSFLGSSKPKEKRTMPDWKTNESIHIAKELSKKDGEDLYGGFKKRHGIPG